METSYQQYFELHQLLRETSVSSAQPSYMLHRVIITELKVFLLFGAGNDGLLTKVYWFVLQTNNNNQFPLHKVIWQMLSVIPTKTLRIVSSPVLSLSSWLLRVCQDTVGLSRWGFVDSSLNWHNNYWITGSTQIVALSDVNT